MLRQCRKFAYLITLSLILNATARNAACWAGQKHCLSPFVHQFEMGTLIELPTRLLFPTVVKTQALRFWQTPKKLDQGMHLLILVQHCQIKKKLYDP